MIKETTIEKADRIEEEKTEAARLKNLTVQEKETTRVEDERLSKLTFPERVEEVRQAGFMVGREDASGQADATSARQTNPTQGKLTVIRDEYKYSVNLDEVTKSNWPLQAKKVGDILGVTFEVVNLEKGNPEDLLVKSARDAARLAGGEFVLSKKVKV